MMAAAEDPHTGGGLHDGEAAGVRLGAALGGRLPGWLDATGDRPAVTAFDLTGDVRTELSVATLRNWSVKAANLLQWELPGRVAAHGDVALRTAGHWAAVPVALAAWRLGRSVVAADAQGAAQAPLRVAFEDRAGPDDLVVGAGMGGALPPGSPHARAFTTEVLGEPDQVDAPGPDPDAVALHVRATRPDARAGTSLSDAAGSVAAGTEGGVWLVLPPVDGAAGLVAVAASVLAEARLVVGRSDAAAPPGAGGAAGLGSLPAGALRRIVDTERVTVVLAPPHTPPEDADGLGVPVVTLPAW